MMHYVTGHIDSMILVKTIWIDPKIQATLILWSQSISNMTAKIKELCELSCIHSENKHCNAILGHRTRAAEEGKS